MRPFTENKERITCFNELPYIERSFYLYTVLD